MDDTFPPDSASTPAPPAPQPWYSPGQTDENGFDLRIGLPVRFIGGRYNGFEGAIHLAGDTSCSVLVSYEGKQQELVEDFQWLVPLQFWRAQRSATELKLRGH